MTDTKDMIEYLRDPDHFWSDIEAEEIADKLEQQEKICDEYRKSIIDLQVEVAHLKSLAKIDEDVVMYVAQGDRKRSYEVLELKGNVTTYSDISYFIPMNNNDDWYHLEIGKYAFVTREEAQNKVEENRQEYINYLRSELDRVSIKRIDKEDIKQLEEVQLEIEQMRVLRERLKEEYK